MESKRKYHKEKSAKHFQDNKEKIYKRNKEKRVRHKKQAVDYFNNTCHDCGCTSEYQEIFDFHHKNPEEKEFSIAHIIHYSWAKIENELKKCIMLCANCHRIRHAKENNFGSV
jgi:Rieske Fe-S protein